MTQKTRTRFAPSPTGFMHVGGIRTALFAWLLARQNNGEFILRIEDTDQKREVAGSEAHIQECLAALGMSYDEGPNGSGNFGPYKQSERVTKDLYTAAAQHLIDSGRAYADPYTSDELQAFREEAKASKQAFLYRNRRPENPPAWDGSQPLRFKADPKNYSWHDEVMGDLQTGPEVIDDFILIKSDGFPTYNFAHIVDDAAMEITHVIRGQEFISSQPNYFNLYEAMGITPPIFATMPHIMAPTGNKKLSKRDGAKDILNYLKDGYTKEALVNFIASMGWNDGTEQEIFTVDELIEKFSLDRVQRSGARFDEQRLLWMNGQHIRTLSGDDLSRRVAAFWPLSAEGASSERKNDVLRVVQERLKTLADLPVLTSYFFERPQPKWSMVTENKQLKKLELEAIKSILEQARDSLVLSEFDEVALQNSLNHLLESSGHKPAILFSLVRFTLTWAPFSPALNETLALIGKDESLARLDVAIETIPTS